MRFFKHFTIGIMSLLLFKCTNVDKNDLIGTYKVMNNVNTIDTLRVLKNGKYQRGLYRKVDKSLIYKHQGSWNYENGMIDIEDFFMDTDREYGNKKGGFKESSMDCIFEVETIFGRIYIGKKISGIYLYVKL